VGGGRLLNHTHLSCNFPLESHVISDARHRFNLQWKVSQTFDFFIQDLRAVTIRLGAWVKFRKLFKSGKDIQVARLKNSCLARVVCGPSHAIEII